jgi:methylglyoxal synthase
MAYPSVSAPYGLIPINLIGGQVFAGATRQIPIATNSSTAIYYGDVVKLNSGGTLDKDTGTNAATPVGVFLGCSYTDPVFGKTFRQYYPGTTNISDVVAYVQDDPDALYKVAVVSSGTTISYVNRTSVGNNAVLVQNSGSTITGNSQVAVSATTNTTSTWPVRVVDVIPETATAGNPGSYTEVIVKWNQGMHQYLNPTGV